MILASVNGDRLAYVADGALGEEALGNRSPAPQQILASAGRGGWVLAGYRHAQ